MSLEVDIETRLPDFALAVRFAVAAPGVTALFGPSGAGKTSVIEAVAGHARPDRGLIRIAGETVFDSATGRFVAPRRRGIGYVFQEARLFPHLTVAGNLDFGARRAARPPEPRARAHLVEMLGIGPLLGRRPARLSGGERQRVALGRALLAGPRLLLLDEPLAALDAPRKGEILPYLERLRDEAALPILYVSHSLDEVTRLADEMVVMSTGRVRAQGPTETVMARLDLFPLTGRFEAGAVIQGQIARHLAADGLTEVAFTGGRLILPAVAGDPGAVVRLRVRARDVLIATEPPRALSARNILAATIREIRPETGPFADLRLDCGGTDLLARVTRQACAELGLAPGRPVFAIVKTVSIARAAGPPSGTRTDRREPTER